MKSLPLIILFVLIQTVAAIGQDLIRHEVGKFSTDAKALWKDELNGRIVPSGAVPQKVVHSANPQPREYANLLVFLSRIDTTDYRQGAGQQRYFKTTYYFGFRDRKHIMQLSQPVYADTSYARRCPRLIWIAKNNSYYLVTHDFKDNGQHDVSLWTIDESGTLSGKTLTRDPLQGDYTSIDYGYRTDKGTIDVTVTYLRWADTTVVEHIFNAKHVGKPSFFADTIQNFLNKDDYRYSTPLRHTRDEYTDKFVYSEASYYLSNHPVYRRTKIPVSPNSQVIRYSHAELDSDRKKGWKNVKDIKNRNASSLYLMLLTDSTDYKTDKLNKKYYKTSVRFGFEYEPQGYELPEVFYILEDHKNEMESRMISRKEPCLLFRERSFYLFVPSYKGNEEEESIMYTCTVGQGLFRQSLWTGHPFASANIPYFSAHPEYGFVLSHSNIGLNAEMSTYIKDGYWETVFDNIRQPLDKPWPETIADQLDLRLADNHRYREPHPYFTTPKPLAYRDTILPKGTFFLHNFAVFLDTEESRARYQKALKKKFFIPKANIAEYGNNALTVDDHIAQRVFYKPVPYTLLMVPYMPALRQQGIFPSCLSYAYGALYQHAIDSHPMITELRKLDPNAFRKETEISYFSMQQYVRGNKYVDPKTAWKYGRHTAETSQKQETPHFDFESTDIKKGLHYPQELMLQNAQQYDSIPLRIGAYFNKLDPTIKKGQDGYTWFRNYLEKLYNDNKGKKLKETVLVSLIQEFGHITGIPESHIPLSDALQKETFNQFLYSIFFEKADEYIHLKFADSVLEDHEFSDRDAMKQAIVDMLYKGMPVLVRVNCFPHSATDKRGHAVLITGYQQVSDPVTNAVYDVFKVHNSWSLEWEEFTNYGWFFADHLLYASQWGGFESSNPNWILSTDYIEKTADYRRLTDKKENHKDMDGPIGLTTGKNQVDIAPLYQFLLDEFRNKSTTEYYESIGERVNYVKKFMKKLGYRFLREESKYEYGDAKLFYEGMDWTQVVDEDHIWFFFKNREELETFKSKVDFSKAMGKFTQESRGYDLKPNGERVSRGYSISVTYSWSK